MQNNDHDEGQEIDGSNRNLPKRVFNRRTVLGGAAAGFAGILSTGSVETLADGSYTAVNDGDWSDPATWESNAVPTDGSDVRIQEGVTVTVAEPISTRVKYLEVVGTLRHAPDRDTKLRVETIETRSGSRYEIGTSSTPIQQGVTAEVEFIDEGPIDENEWPERKNKGLVAHGAVEIVGAEKTAWTDLSGHPTAGDTTIELPSEPTNWNAGDELVVPGFDYYTSTSLDDTHEERTIASVDGTTVTLDSALEYDHVPPKSGLDAYVLNLTRNVTMWSENTAEHRRGHVMIMSTATDVRYARFHEMGRTNKDEPITTPPRNGDTVDADDPNPSARYSFHYHHTGIDAEPHVARGLVMDRNPGWGFVNHHAHAQVSDCITYDVLGSGFVAEGGNERGFYDNCIAIKSKGSGDPIDSRAAGAHGGDPPIDDFGHAGHGFWLQSPLLKVTNCVAGGHRHQAFVWWLRPLLEGDLAEGSTIDDSRVTYHPNLPWKYCDTDRPLFEAIERGRFSNHDDVMRDTKKIPSTFANVKKISGNTAFGSAGGADFSRHNFKWKHERFQDFNVVDDMTVHSIGPFVDSDGHIHEPNPPRHLSSGSQGRGGNVGVSFRYTSNVTLRNSNLYGNSVDNSFGVPYHDYLWTVTIDDCTIEDWDWGVVTGEHRVWWIRNNAFAGNDLDVHWSFNNDGQAILEGNDLNLVQNKFQHINEKATEVFGFGQTRGVQIDDRSVHVAASAPDFVPFPDQDSLDGVNHLDKVFDNPGDLVGLTSGEIWNNYEEAIGGRLLPDDAVSEPYLDGCLIDPQAFDDPPKSVYLDSTTADSLGAWEVVSETDTAGGKALRWTGSSSPKDDAASIDFDCAAGTYRIFGRFRPNAWNGDDLYFRIDGGTWYTAEKLKTPIGFAWHGASPNGGAKYEWDLSEGTHTLEFACDNDGALLDEIFVGSDSEVLGAYGKSNRDSGGSDNTAPSVSDDSASVTEGETVTIEVLSNDSDSDGSLDPSTVTVVSSPSNGSTTVNSDGTIDYAHDGSDTTSDSFTYTVDDDDGATSNEATVSVEVTAPEQAPYTDHDLSRIEAEDFDVGGEGVAYHDTSDGNNGDAYRDTDVDIEATSDDGGGYNVGWIESGEWWEYTVDVPLNGEYDLTVRLAGKNATTLDVSVDGSHLATVDVPDTGGWQTWTTVDVGTVTLSSGTHVFRLEANGGHFNVNWFGFTEHSDTTAPTAPSNLSVGTVTRSSVDLSWDGSSDSGTGVDHYEVYQDGTAVQQVSAGTTKTTVSGLQEGTSYDFHVTAVDGAGNESDPSNTVTATTTDVKTVAVTGDGAASYNGGTSVRYIIETSGTIESAGTGDLESTDREGGSEAAGRVPADGSDTDTYSLVGGKVTDVSTWGGDVTVTVDGTTWSG